jgi:NAD+ synthase (glutamine-hydrolysing)
LKTPYRVAIAQVNSTLGNFSENANKILDFVQKAHSMGAHLVLFPEASLMGYHPFDLLERPDFVANQMKQLNQLVKKIPKDLLVLVGVIRPNKNKKGRPYYNSAALLKKDKVAHGRCF